jgi:hypothetical protein
MASIIRIKRSSTAGNPSTLGAGELAYSAYSGSGGNRLYIGIGAETSGNAVNHYVIGGTYYTGLIDASTAGTLTTSASSIPVLSATGTIDKWLVGNTQLLGNTLSTTNTNGNLVLNPNGTGMVQIAGTWTLPRSAGTNGYALITNGTDTASWQAISTTLTIAAGGASSGTVNLLNQTLTVTGGNGITTSMNGQTLTISSIGAGGYQSTATGGTTTTLTASSSANQFFTGSTTQTVKLPDTTTLTLGQEFFITNNSTGAITVQTSAGGAVTTIPGGSQATFTVASVSAQTWIAEFTGNNTLTGTGAAVLATSPTLVTPTLGVASATTINKVTITAPATGSTLTIADGKTLTASNTLTFTGTDGSSAAFGSGGTVAYQGGTLAQFASTTSSQLAGVISDETGSGSLVFGTSPTLTTSVVAGSASMDVFNTTASTLNFAGAASTLAIGSTSGTVTINNPTVVGSQTTVNLWNTTSTTVNAFGASTATTLGASTGTFTVNSVTLAHPNATTFTMNGASPSITTTSTGTASVFNTNALTGALFGAASAITIGNTTYGKISTSSSAVTITAGTNTSNAGINLVPQGTGTVDVGGGRITGVGTPTQTTDAATKGYVDSVKQALDIKDSVRVATTANLTATASGTGLGKTLTNSGTQAAITIDSVPLSSGDRVLVKDQTTGADNGIYTVTTVGTGSTNWVLTRATDADNSAPTNEVTAGLFTFVEEGTVNQDSGWVLSTNSPITLDTTALTFVQFSGAGQIIAGTGLSKSGNTLSVNASQTQITALGTIGTGTWQGTVIAPTYGGTGVNNGASTITLGGSLTFSGAYTSSFTLTANTAVTLPTTGTLATLAGTEALSNKTITASSFSGTTVSASGNVTFTSTTDASALGTAPVVLSGGMSVAKSIYVGTNITGAGAATSTLDGFQIDGGTY